MEAPLAHAARLVADVDTSQLSHRQGLAQLHPGAATSMSCALWPRPWPLQSGKGVPAPTCQSTLPPPPPPPREMAQVGAAFMSHQITTPEGRSLKFEIWDTAGQERYLSLAPLYYRVSVYEHRSAPPAAPSSACTP